MPAALARPTQAPEVVGISRATLYRWAKDGHVKLYRQGRMTFFRPEEVAAYITGNVGTDVGNSAGETKT